MLRVETILRRWGLIVGLNLDFSFVPCTSFYLIPSGSENEGEQTVSLFGELTVA